MLTSKTTSGGRSSETVVTGQQVSEIMLFQHHSFFLQGRGLYGKRLRLLHPCQEPSRTIWVLVGDTQPWS